MTSYERGLKAEETAARYLQQKGYRIREKRYRVVGGELDLVAEKDGVLVFVEVKYRSYDRFGAPFEALTAQKKKFLTRAMGVYLRETCQWDGSFRFDLICISGPAMTEIRHYQNVFTPGGWL